MTDGQRSKPVRAHLAAQVRVTRFAEGAPHALRVDSVFEMPGWTPRSPSSFGRAPFPGTPIRFEGSLYEVVRFDSKLGTFPRFSYALDPWEERFPVRGPLELSREECERFARERKERARQHRHSGLLLLLSPIVGLLPAADQLRIERDHGVPALRLTFWSALPLFVVSVVLLMARLAEVGGGTLLSDPILLRLVPGLTLLSLDAALRLVVCMKLGQPMGALVVVLPLELVRALLREVDPEARRKRFERMDVGPRGARRLAEARDEVLEVYGKEHDLEVRSILPKPHWSPQTGVRYLDVWYVPIDSRSLQGSDGVSYVFLLKKAPDHLVFRTTCDYSPEEIRELFREKERRDRGGWVEMFAPLLGLLAAEDQARLREVHGFDALHFTRWTVVLLSIGALGSLGAIAVNLGSRTAAPADLAIGAVSLLILLESPLRWRALRRGEPSGSVLGLFVRPFARRLLD